jgi:2-amino-4-hydroxy-6-hydroxymethyldihydropteridine diphosphokinase
MDNVFFSLGSNLGDRKKNIEKAILSLQRILKEGKISRIYETEPLYYARQPKFLNVVVCGNLSFKPQKLLSYIHRLENRLGRRREGQSRFGPRMIDIDILLYGDEVVNQKNLKIPHPRMHERKFVILPLIELAPFLRDPASGELYWKYLLKISGQGVYFHSFSRYT